MIAKKLNQTILIRNQYSEYCIYNQRHLILNLQLYTYSLEKDYKIVGSQDQINRDLEVEVLSVKFSKIGQKTFDQYPNLRHPPFYPM